MNRILNISILFLCSLHVCGQQDSLIVKVHFLYGSKPLREFKKTEFKWFGGLHGGHVTLEINNIDYSFGPMSRLHIFPRKKSFSSYYTGSNTYGKPMVVAGCKYACVEIPISEKQYKQTLTIVEAYNKKVPYDYAFFGMRCAASTHDVLGKVGVLKERGRAGYIFHSFYPKLLRKKIFRLAEENDYHVYRQEGKPTRKWEKD